MVVSYAAVLCLVTQRSSLRTWGGALRDDTKNGCVGDYINGIRTKSTTKGQ